MELINEASSLQRNKNFFNKLKSALLKEFKDGTNDIGNDVIIKGYPDERFRIIYRYDITDIKFVEEREKVYVLAFLKFELVKLRLRYGNDLEDCAFDYIKDQLSYSSWCDRNGFPNGENTTNDEILKSDIYKSLKRSIDEFLSCKISTTLDGKVYPSLKIRENVMPLAFYSLKENKLNYPWSTLWSSNPMSSSSRDTKSNIEASRDIKDVVKDCKRHAPFQRWLILKSDYSAATFRQI